MQTPSSLITEDLTVEEAFSQVLQGNLSGVKEWAPVALAGEDIEGVHQMRVCLRRMRSALTVYRTAIPKKATKSFAKDMRWASKALDRARDLDVYITENLASKRKGQQRSLRKIAESHREKAYGKVGSFIKGKEYADLCKKISEWTETKAWRKQLSTGQQDKLQENITPFSARVLESHRSAILAYGTEIEHLDSETLHRLRIECKKLRYATEFFAPLYGDQMKAFTGHLKNLQDLLGALHDTAVMKGLHVDLLKKKKDKKLASFTHKLERRRQRDAQKILKKLSSRWQAFALAERPWDGTTHAVA